MGKRLLIYSHDSFGIGHIRRVQKISQYLIERIEGLSILVITGSPHLQLLTSASGVDFVKIPTLEANYIGNNKKGYVSPTMQVRYDDLLNMRQAIILAVAQNFNPHIFWSDLAIAGIDGELLETLVWLKSRTKPCKTIIGFRDIIDEPSTVTRKWKQRGAYDTLGRFYDRILVYGLKEVYDFGENYGFDKQLLEKTKYCGYLISKVSESYNGKIRSSLGVPKGHRLLLGMVGGGIDGAPIMQALLSCSHELEKTYLIAVLGPSLPLIERQEIKAKYGRNPNVRVLDFVKPESMEYFIAASDLIVTMGGYNSICETIGSAKPIIVIPRNTKEGEQLLRATLFSELNLVQSINKLPTSSSLRLAINRAKVASPLSERAKAVLVSKGFDNVTEEILRELSAEYW